MRIDTKELKQRYKILCRAEELYHTELKRVRKKCKHDYVGEWKPRDHSEELRICLDCGAEEGGWGCGFQVLGPRAREVKPLTREEFFAQRKPRPRYVVGNEGD